MDFLNNGKLVAAVITLVDAIFGVLVALGTISVSPSEAVVAGVVTAAFNVAGLIWAYIQHQQSQQAARLAHDVRMNSKAA